LVQTKLAGDASFCPRRVFRKTIGLPATIVNPLDFRPHFLEIDPDTIHAEAYYSGDCCTTLAALPAGTHANMVVFKESFSTNVHDLVVKGFRFRVSGVREEKQENRTVHPVP
jgi:hypothetical protein